MGGGTILAAPHHDAPSLPHAPLIGDPTMPATASRRRARRAASAVAYLPLLPTVFLQRVDRGAVRDALDALPDQAAARERMLDTIEFLDAIETLDMLGADAIAG